MMATNYAFIRKHSSSPSARCTNLYSRTTYFHKKFSLSSAYALTTYSDRRMRLITRFYGTTFIDTSQVIILAYIFHTILWDRNFMDVFSIYLIIMHVSMFNSFINPCTLTNSKLDQGLSVITTSISITEGDCSWSR